MSSTTYRCNACECGTCYYCAPDASQTDNYGASLGDNLPMYCPLYGEAEVSPDWIMTVSPAHRGGYKWLVEGLLEWVDNHYDDCPRFVQDAAYGQLIQPNRAYYLKQIDLLRMLADMADNDIYDYEERERIKKVIDKTKKIDLINDIIPAAFAAGVIYSFIRLKTSELDGMEEV